MRNLTFSLLAIGAAAASVTWLAGQQISGQIEKNPGKPRVAVTDFLGSGGAAPLMTAFNTTVAKRSGRLARSEPGTENVISSSAPSAAIRPDCGCCATGCGYDCDSRQEAYGLELTAGNGKLSRPWLWG